MIRSCLILFVICSSLGCKKEISKSNEAVPTPLKPITYISAEEAAILHSADPRVIFLDVRTPEETKEGMIDGAIQIDVKSETFKNRINELDKSEPYLVYCRSGRRSKKAAEIMQQSGFVDLRSMDGGYLDWQDLNK